MNTPKCRLQYCFFLLLLWVAGEAKAVNSYQVYGLIRDSLTGEKKVGAVIGKDSIAISVTNNAGAYSILLPEGIHQLTFSFPGYITKTLLVHLQGNLSLDVDLVYITNVGQAKIYANKAEDIAQTSQMGKVTLSAQAIKKVPVMFGESDVLKVLQMLPGVKPGMEGTSGIFVRGGSPDQNLILLDGTPLYNVSHLYGFFSVFNTDAINQVELTKGGFPARYGGRLSSVIDITMKDGNMKKWKGSANLGLISANGTIEGPLIKNKLSLIVSARRTYVGQIFQSLQNSPGYYGKQGYHFYDINGKINYRPNSKHQILLSTYLGDDQFYNNVKPYRFLYDGNIYENEEKDELGWGNRLVSLRWNHRINPKWFGVAIANYTRYKYDVLKLSRKTTYNDTGVITEKFGQEFNSMVKDWGFKYELDYQPNNRHQVKMGMNQIFHSYNPGITRYDLVDDEAKFKFDSTFGSKEVRAWETQWFIEDDFLVGERWKFNAGLHYSAFLVDGTTYGGLQPRFSGRYLFLRNWALKFSASRMVQYIHLLTNSTVGLPTDLWVPSVKQLKPENSWQYSVGLARTYKSWLFTLEGYFKTMNNVLDYKNGATFYNTYEEWFNKVEAGKGRSYGMELLIQRKVGRMTGWLGYTLSKTDRIFPTINFGKRFPFKYDSRHNITLVWSYEIDEKHSININGVYATGNAFTLANVRHSYSSGGNIMEVETFDKRNQFRGADYHRVDIGYTRHYLKKWGGVDLNLGFYNMYSRRNPFYYRFGNDFFGNRVLYRVALFPIIPYITLNVQFK